ncbi:MAG TPA: TetR/AcrR family transcriptional regulator [Streptosporangiaceae bacterium]|nr:TetR/AcrR family transcriptional regulator [Streptosporangiaceae bacterium]
MPTGIALRDARTQLFEAAERVLLRDGPGGLTSRAVTAEAGVAKGVLHRHFADFDGFLAELVLDRIGEIRASSAALRDSAGTGTVTGNLTIALADLLESVCLALIGLVIARDELRTRLRAAGAGRLPVAVETSAMIATYLAAEREIGRVSPEADIDALAPTLTGAIHLLYADRERRPASADAVAAIVTTVIAGVVREP